MNKTEEIRNLAQQIGIQDMKNILEKLENQGNNLENKNNKKGGIYGVIDSINNYDSYTLKKSINKSNVNKKIFKVFEHHEKPEWTPLMKIANLKEKRERDKRCDGKIIIENEDNDCELATIVIDNGADLNFQGPNGNTPLHSCIYLENYKLMELLVRGGADVNIQDNNGNTPLLLSADRNLKDFSDFLIKNGADKNIRNINGENFFDIIEWLFRRNKF